MYDCSCCSRLPCSSRLSGLLCVSRDSLSADSSCSAERHKSRCSKRAQQKCGECRQAWLLTECREGSPWLSPVLQDRFLAHTRCQPACQQGHLLETVNLGLQLGKPLLLLLLPAGQGRAERVCLSASCMLPWTAFCLSWMLQAQSVSQAHVTQQHRKQAASCCLSKHHHHHMHREC